MRIVRITASAAMAAALLATSSGLAGASHSWGTYHWARTSNPFSIQIIDSMTSNWDARLNAINADWNQSTVMDNVIVAGDSSQGTRKKCAQVSGKIRSCNAPYGFNGWLGIATIRISGSHITSGTSKMNDSYFGLNAYNTEEARRHVACQEIGHLFGLDHQTATSCMDDNINKINDPAYVSPNQHDYDQLATIYAHLDSSSTIAAPAPYAAPIVEADSEGVTVTWIFWADPRVTMEALLADVA